MAYWNPFGWDEETRRGIQSIVRPVMQVASFAGSMGAFSGGSAAAAGTTGSGSAGGAAAAAGTDTSGALPFEAGMDLDLGIGNTYDADTLIPGSTAQFTDAPTGSLEFNPNVQSFTGNTPGVIAVDPGATFNPNMESLTGNTYSADTLSPGSTQPFTDTQASVEAYDAQQGINPNFGEGQVQQQTGTQNKVGDKVGQDTGTALEMGPGDVVTKVVPPKPTQTTTQQPGQAKPPATETPGKPPTTKTPNNQHPDEVKPPQTEGPGPGGKKKSIWEGGLNWENIQKFLASDEGKKWMLSDKGLMGIGRRILEAADAGTSAYNALSPEERKKIWARLTKERNERKRKKKRMRRGE